MLNRFWGEKNSIKRMFVSYSLCFVLVALGITAMVLFHYHFAVRQYDQILQNIVSIDSSKHLVGELESSSRSFCDTRSSQDYQQFLEDRDSLARNLTLVSEIARHPSSQLSISSVFSLLNIADQQLALILEGTGAEPDAARLAQCYENIHFLLNRVENLEVTYATEVYPQLSSHMTALIRTSLMILVLMTLTTVIALANLHAQIYTPLQRLVNSVQEIAKGNFDQPDLEVDGHSELNRLSSSINDMKHGLSRLIATREEKLKVEKMLKEAQFQALQSQVNPHFLFNVLGAATAMALTEGADKTLDIVESISYMLRYSLQATKTNVTLREEIKNVQVYLFLQNQRFGDRLTFTLDIDEDALDVPVPGMTVQPIVENAIVHGCDKMERGGWLRLSCHRSEDGRYVTVRVENNGDVLSPDQLDAFNRWESIPHSAKTTGIGLANVRDRIQSFYERSDLMDCTVQDGTVTVVTMRYPTDERST